jgi:hypothetical protein
VGLPLSAGWPAPDWGARTRVLAAAAPGLLVLWLPIALGLPLIYPWAGGVEPGEASPYLEPASFIVRGLAALAVWALLGWRLGRGGLSRGFLGIALAAHGVLVVMVAVDWVLSLSPGWMASNFGMNLAAQQIAAGAAAAALVGGGGATATVRRDLTTLVVAGVLGVAYLAFMDYLVVWYGDQPDRVVWYLARDDDVSRLLVGAALAVGALAPAIIAASPGLSTGLKARLAAACALAGLGLYQLFLLRPLIGGLSLLAALLGLVVQGAALAWLGVRRSPGAAERELAHG